MSACRPLRSPIGERCVLSLLVVGILPVSPWTMASYPLGDFHTLEQHPGGQKSVRNAFANEKKGSVNLPPFKILLGKKKKNMKCIF